MVLSCLSYSLPGQLPVYWFSPVSPFKAVFASVGIAGESNQIAAFAGPRTELAEYTALYGFNMTASVCSINMATISTPAGSRLPNQATERLPASL